nr:MAG TPA: hypothetical protein [Caudoviricetes sp.]
MIRLLFYFKCNQNLQIIPLRLLKKLHTQT